MSSLDCASSSKELIVRFLRSARPRHPQLATQPPIRIALTLHANLNSRLITMSREVEQQQFELRSNP
jgi:hypothetical protein